MKKTKTSDIPHESPSRDTTGRYPTDQLLRKHGFRIHARPTGSEPLWERQGRVYTHAQATAAAHLERAAAAKLLEDSYHHSE